MTAGSIQTVTAYSYNALGLC